METSLVYPEESYNIIGACYEVHNDKGSGFLEAVYQECLALEFAGRGIPFVEKPPLPLEYKGRRLQQTFEPDFVCFGKIIVEIEAAKRLTDEHKAQVMNYLRATGMKLGLLVNFSAHRKLEELRIVNARGDRLR